MQLLIIYTGMFNVAPKWEDPAPIRWALVTARENSIKSRAASITGTTRRYRFTHNQRTKPVPPDIAKSAEHMSVVELF